MAVKEILKVDVDTTEFDTFKKAFDSYLDAVKALPGEWAKSSTEIAATRTHFEQMADSIRGQAEDVANIVTSSGKIGAGLEGAGLALAGMAKSGRLFAGSIFQATASLRHWSKLTAVFGGLIGAGGLFGLSRMALNVANNRSSAAGLGVTYGELQSARVNFGRIPGFEGILQGFSQAEVDISKQYALRQYLGHAGSGDPARDLAEGLGRFKTLVDQTPKELLGPALQQRGYNKLGIDTETALAVKGMSRGEIEQIGRGYGADLATRLGLDPGTARKWTEFTTKVEKAGEDIDTILWKGTSKLTKPMEDLSLGFEHLVSALLRPEGPISDWIKDLGHGIHEFADTLGSGAAQRKAADLGRDVAAVARLLEAIVATNPRGLAVLIGTYEAAKWGGGAAVGIGTALARSRTLGAAGRLLGAAGAPEIAAAGALGATLYPQPLNAGEDERARQERFRKGDWQGPMQPDAQGPWQGPPMPPRPMPKGVFPEVVPPTRPGGLSDKSAIWLGRKGEPQPLEVIHGSTKGVDKRLMESVAAGAAHLPPGYKVKIFSGYRPGDRGAHGRGQAIDVEIVDPHGNVILSRGEDKTGMYRLLAKATRDEMKAKYPDLAAHNLAWGGSFGTQKGGGGVSDLMHFDIMRRRGGIRASHYPQVQDLGPLPPLNERTLGAYIHPDNKHSPASRGAGHSRLSHRGDHPATMGKTAPPVEIEVEHGMVVTPR